MCTSLIHQMRRLFLLENPVPIQEYQTPHQDPETNRNHPTPARVDIEGNRGQAEERHVFEQDVRHVCDRFGSEIEFENVIKQQLHQHIQEDQSKVEHDPRVTSGPPVGHEGQRQRDDQP